MNLRCHSFARHRDPVCAGNTAGLRFEFSRAPGRRAVALVITLVLLSVITFMAIAFLVLSRGERGSVANATEQATARNAADVALARAESDLVADIIAYGNEFNYDLRVSTNFINPIGFDPSPPAPQRVDSPTNVNYDYTVARAPLSLNDRLQNLANLMLDPRPPVFITNRFRANTVDFRYYLDLNRNGRPETNGWQPVISWDPGLPYYDTNGNMMKSMVFGNTASNCFVGDPEWIGGLEFMDRRHSATNKFLFRYAYLAVPVGKTLDLNRVHNFSKVFSGLQRTMVAGNDGFMRNQGVGTFEMNLAAFLVDLNTNIWPAFSPTVPAGYQYIYGNLAIPNRGVAFDDALSILSYRYRRQWDGVPPSPPFSVLRKFGTRGQNAFNYDNIDGYSAGPLMLGTRWPTNGPDADFAPRPRTQYGWPGSENPNQYFSQQELFDPNKTSFAFSNRLWTAGVTNDSSYNRYTFYRLLSQMGTDTAYEGDRINVNYRNVDDRGRVVPSSETNFVAWNTPSTGPSDPGGAVIFFTNAVERMLRAEGYPFGATYIPVFTNNVFVYSPSVNRLLQLAANIYDSTTNRASVPPNFLNYPTVFQPLFFRTNENGLTSIYITRFAEVTDMAFLQRGLYRDLSSQKVASSVQPNDMIFGVPFIVGAKQGLPNFNKFSMQNLFQITRKMQIHRASTTRTDAGNFTTNIMYVVGFSNTFGVEAWNSYYSNYTRPIDIYATNIIGLALTNDYQFRGNAQPRFQLAIGNRLSIPNGNTNLWYGNTNAERFSFQVPLLTNMVVLPDSIFKFASGLYDTNLNTTVFEKASGHPYPRWGLAITNRLLFMMVDRGSGRLIDYVELNGMDTMRDLSQDLCPTNGGTYFEGMWNTNRYGGYSVNHPFEGEVYQVGVSKGDGPSRTTDWNQFGVNQVTGITKDREIAKFRAIFGLSDPNFPNMVNTNLDCPVPFSPTARVYQYQTWQANDPLVHYTVDDLQYLVRSNGVRLLSLRTGGGKPIAIPNLATNLGTLNDRYSPWGGNPKKGSDAEPDTAFNTALKDPLVRRSDFWEFPTNKFPNIGWLGRVHRGTPWQTVYLKSTNVIDTVNGLNIWKNWSGHGRDYEAARSAPVNDRLLLDVFTTGFSEAAMRGQLSINQTNLAAWSAVLAGVIGLQADTNADVTRFNPGTRFQPVMFEPAGWDLASPTNYLGQVVAGIGRARNSSWYWRTNAHLSQMALTGINDVNTPGHFTHLGDILAVPELTDASPLLNRTNISGDANWTMSDAVVERLPQQILGLLQCDHVPRFVIYSYGQALKPADKSIVTGGQFFGMCTNYQITAEVATRAVVRVEGAPKNPKVVVENFNVLPPD